MGTVHAKAANKGENYSQSDKNHVPDDNKYNSTNNVDPPDNFNDEWDLLKQKQALERKSPNLQETKARVDKIHVDGLIRTKDDIIKTQVADLFKAQNFHDVIVRAHRVRGRLAALGCFQRIGIYIDTSQGPDATPEGLEVTFTVHELSRIVGGINTMVGNNEGCISAEAKLPNLFGRGERLQVEYSYGTKNSNNINISVVKPIIDSRFHTMLSGSIFGTSNEYPWSGYGEKDRGLLLDVALSQGGLGTLKHNFQYEATYRKIHAHKLASFCVREHCGPSLKSALRHICTSDKRDSKIFPTRGSYVQFSTEVAGLGGNIGFVKNELMVQSNWTPHKLLTLQLGVQSGLLRGISNDLKINIADHFFLGGPLNVRGFDMRGCGPRNGGNSLGGDVYWAVALHAYTPLPFMSERNRFGDLFRLHGFINGGNVANFTFKLDNYKESMKIFTENVCCSIGGGIAVKFGEVARVELNMTMPLLYVRSDVLQQIQFGIGMQYL